MHSGMVPDPARPTPDLDTADLDTADLNTAHPGISDAPDSRPAAGPRARLGARPPLAVLLLALVVLATTGLLGSPWGLELDADAHPATPGPESESEPAADGPSAPAPNERDGPEPESQADDDSPAQPVHFARVRAGSAVQAVRLTGVVESARRATVAAEVAGTVRALRVREGDAVRAGQVLAELRRRPLALRVDAVRGQVAEAEAELGSAELRARRLEELGTSAVVSTQQVDDARFEVEARQGQLAQLRAELARLEDQLERATPRAPFDAVVIAEHAEAGEWLDVGQPVVELVALDSLQARFEVSERYFSRLRPGMPVRVRLDAREGVEVRGTLRAIVPRASERARMFPALVELPADARLGIGMLVHADLDLDLDQGPGPGSSPGPGNEPGSETNHASGAAWLVPRDALLYPSGGAGRAAVFVIDERQTVRRVRVDLADRSSSSGSGAWVGVRGALGAGDRVVTRGNEGLRPGDRVTAVHREPSTP